MNFLEREESGYYTWPKTKDMGNVRVEYIFAAKVRFLGKEKDEGGVGFAEEEKQLQDEYESYKHNYMAFARFCNQSMFFG